MEDEEERCGRCGMPDAAWSALFAMHLCDLCRKTVTEAELRWPGRALQAVAPRRPGGLVAR